MKTTCIHTVSYGRALSAAAACRCFLIMFLVLTAGAVHAQIVYSDYSDPDVCEGTDGDYWMTASSFQCTPGLPILHSTDLTHWTLVNYAMPRLKPYCHYDTIQHGCGVWAPSIRRHRDTYYIYYGDPDYGVYMIKTTDPRSGWSEPHLVMEGKGVIDTCPLFDDDGRVYLVNAWANSRAGFNSVLTIRELSADGMHAVSQPVMVYDGQPDGNHTIEGPKLYKRDGYYYILAPAGGVAHGWQVALRSRNIYGPYEQRIVYDQPGIHQGGWVDDAFICFQEVQPYGRILHRLDVGMRDGWPMMKAHKAPTPRLEYASRYLPYQWHANYQDVFGFPTSDGMRVYGHRYTEFGSMWNIPNLYLRKFDQPTFVDTLRTTITAKGTGQESGFIVMGRDYVRLSVELVGTEFVISEARCQNADQGGSETRTRLATLPTRTYEAGAHRNYECSVDFRIECKAGGMCHLSYSTDHRRFIPLATPFQAREGMWIGAKYGVFSISDSNSRGWIDLRL